MEQILHAKSKQVPQFRKALLATKHAKLVCDTRDRFWGSPYKDPWTNKVQGDDNLVKLIRKLQATLSTDQVSSPPQNRLPQSSSTPNPLTQSSAIPTTSPQPHTTSTSLHKTPTSSPSNSLPLTPPKNRQPHASSTPNPLTHSLAIPATSPEIHTASTSLHKTPISSPNPSLPLSSPSSSLPLSPHSMNSSYSIPVSNPFSPLSVNDYALDSEQNSPTGDQGVEELSSQSATTTGNYEGHQSTMRPTPFLSSLNSPESSTSSSLNASPAPSLDQQTHSTTNTTKKPTQSKPKNLSIIGPSIITHKDRPWQLPQMKSKIVVIGDSNISRASQILHEARSIECHSFPGAKLSHFTEMISKHKSGGPEAVILSVGINNRDNREVTHRQQARSMILACSKAFPNTNVYIPQINIPPEITPEQKCSLNSLNQTMEHLTNTIYPNTNIKILPKLPDNLFSINPKDRYRIHWTQETANNMISHWLNNLNHLN